MGYNAERYKTDPEYRARRIASRQKHYNKVKDTPEFKAKRAANYRKWREANSDKVKQHKREYRKQQYLKRKRYLKDPEYAASLTPAERERIQRAIDRAKASCKEYYANHKAECYAMQREWVSKNRERYRELLRQSYLRRKERKAPIGVM